SNDKDDDSFALAAYLPDYRVNAFVEQQLQVLESAAAAASPPPQLVTDLILFSLQPHSKGFLGGCCLQPDHYEAIDKYRAEFQNQQQVNLWITVGGAGRSEAFPEIFRDEKTKKRLIKSAMNLWYVAIIVLGIDLDFTPRTTTERDNYLVFLQEALDQWHAAGLKVSMTTIFHPSTRLLPQLYQQMDRIHLMAYDMIAREGGDNNGDPYHASLDKVAKTIDALLQPGGGLEDTPEKILLGIPAYARHLTVPSNVKTFGEIFDGVVQGSDDPSSIDWATMHSWEGYEWESEERIQGKTQLARERKLGGIFFWEIGQDKVTETHPRGILIEAAAAAIRNETAAYISAASSPEGEL
ncbi:MAG: hypothetical protein SGILL_006314, partial [Bacillariaceae sp.]